MILVGSSALHQRGLTPTSSRDFSYILSYIPSRDVDLVGSWEEVLALHLAGAASVANRGRKVIFFAYGSRPVEIELTWSGSTAEQFAVLVATDPDTVSVPIRHASSELAHCGNGDVQLPSRDALFALKTTHRLVSGPHFWKTHDHWHALRKAGATITPRYSEWVVRREAETYKRKPPRLAKMSRAAFFNQHAVPYAYDHDAIHRVVAHGQVPAYTLFKKDGEEVECQREKFEALPFETQLASVAEEAYVLAIERAHVPHGRLSAYSAFELALEKICCGIASGWWRNFAYEHLVAVRGMYDTRYLEKFQQAVAQGTILRYEANGLVTDESS